MSGSKKPSTPRAFTGDTELCHEYRIDQIKPLIGKHLGPITIPQIAEFVEIFPGLDKEKKDATNYIKKMQKGEWFAEKSKSAKEALERCPVEGQPMFKDYNAYAEATGNVTFSDAWRSGDFHALWVGLHGWQEWKEEPKNGGYAGDNGWYRHGARLLCRVQAYYVEQKIRCYKSKEGYLKRKLGTRAAEAGQLGRVNEKPEDHIDMLEIIVTNTETKRKRKHNTSAVAAAVEQEAVEDSVAAVAQASSDAEDRAMEEEEEEEEEEQQVQEEVDDNQSSTDDTSDATRATATKRTSSFDQALATHPDRNVRARFAAFKAAQAQEEEAHQAVNQCDTSLQEAIDTYESTKSVEAKKRAINAMLKQLEPKTTEVASSSRTNREEVNGTAKFLRWFMEHHEDLLPYYTIFAGKNNEYSEKRIWSPRGTKSRLVDLDMVPDNPRNWIHHRIEFKEDDADKAFGQCWNYANWGLPTGKVALEDTYTEWGPSDADTVMHVHTFFLNEPDLDIQDKFKSMRFGVLWPGQEDNPLQFLRILPTTRDDSKSSDEEE